MLPTLGKQQVYVLTSGGTASSSELLMNALRGIDVNVIQIGSTTMGKPYGFAPEQNCGTMYYTIQFKSANENNLATLPTVLFQHLRAKLAAALV